MEPKPLPSSVQPIGLEARLLLLRKLECRANFYIMIHMHQIISLYLFVLLLFSFNIFEVFLSNFTPVLCSGYQSCKAKVPVATTKLFEPGTWSLI